MNKSAITLTLDGDAWQRFRKIVGNGSEAINKYVLAYLGSQNGDASRVDLELLNLDLAETQKILIDAQIEISKLQDKKDAYYEAQQEAEKEKLQNEKEHYEKMNSCIQCGNMLPEKMKTHKFPKGLVCNACFMSATGEDLNKWK